MDTTHSGGYRSLFTGYGQPEISERNQHTTTSPTMQQKQPILIQKLTHSIFPAWVAAVRRQAGALGLAAAIKDEKYMLDPLLARTLASFTNAI